MCYTLGLFYVQFDNPRKNSWAKPPEVTSCRKLTNPLFPPEAAQLPRSCQLYGGAENCFGEWQNRCVGCGMLLELCISLSVFHRLLFHRFISLFFFCFPEVILYICCSCNSCINILQDFKRPYSLEVEVLQKV